MTEKKLKKKKKNAITIKNTMYIGKCAFILKDLNLYLTG